MSAAGNPYLSLVVTARNDDHGGNLLDRMQAFVGGWLEQARRYAIDSELIIVEWNPPAGRPRLRETLSWPADPGPCRVRFIEVPPALHARFAHAEALPLYQMVGKNAGIRRARGEFVLATNIDILFSSELAAFLAGRRLRHGRMYRIDRHDAMSGVPVEAAIEEQLAWCRSHLIRVNTREGTFRVAPDGRPVLMDGDIAAADSGVLFGKGWMPVERYTASEPFRWAGNHAELLLENPPAGASALLLELEPGPGTGDGPLDLEVVGAGYQVLARVTIDRRSRLRLPLAAPLPERIWFHVHGGGAVDRRDPRVLNFRLLRLEWERSTEGGSAASVQPMRRGALVVLLWNALQHLINRLARGGRLVTLTVPVPPRLQRILQAYLDWNGFIGMVRQSSSYFERRRRFRARAAAGADIFAPGSGLAPGAGWSMLEHYRGEAFRTAVDGAEIIVAAGAAGGGELGLQVEASEPVEVTVGGPRRSAEGLAYLSFAVPHVPGRTQILRLCSTAPVKVFWCGWTAPKPAAAHAGAAVTQPWGAGWRWDPAADAMIAADAAELIVRAPKLARQPLYVDLETEAPQQIRIEGATLRADSGRAVYRLDLNLEPGRMHVLDFAPSAPVRAYGCDWNEHPGRPAVFPHTNACGDFTLMSRDDWFDLRGYPEFDLFSMNLDSVFCVSAHYGGVPEEMLSEPMRIYHIEHGTGSGWTPEGQAKLFQRLAERGLTFIDNEDVLAWATQMSRLRAPMIFNHGDWGLACEKLPETELGR